MFLNRNKIIITLSIIGVIFFGGFLAQASMLDADSVGDISVQQFKLAEKSGFSTDANNTIGNVMGYVIKAFIMLLGILFVFLLVLEGYKWMMARGEEEKVREARDGIMRAVIGIIIVISAYAITYFVFTNLPK